MHKGIIQRHSGSVEYDGNGLNMWTMIQMYIYLNAEEETSVSRSDHCQFQLTPDWVLIG